MQRNYKAFVTVIVWCAILIFAGIYLVFRTDGPYGLETAMGDVGYTATVVVLLAMCFDLWIWRIPWVGKKLHTPDLNGAWDGKGKSSRNNDEYEFTLKISQTFLESRIHAYFAKSQSDSFGSVFIHNETLDRTYFVYSYQNDPKIEYRNKAERGEEGGLNIHYGTTKLDIDYDDLKTLNGTYWNDRECVGSLLLTKRGG